MFKKFNNNLNHSPVGAIWGISFSMMLACLFIWSMNSEGVIPRKEVITMLLGYATIFNFAIATYILIKGEIKQINVAYVCPTARQYLSEQEINKIEKVEEE